MPLSHCDAPEIADQKNTTKSRITRRKATKKSQRLPGRAKKSLGHGEHGERKKELKEGI
jgi:hypothetical protein